MWLSVYYKEPVILLLLHDFSVSCHAPRCVVIDKLQQHQPIGNTLHTQPVDILINIAYLDTATACSQTL